MSVKKSKTTFNSKKKYVEGMGRKGEKGNRDHTRRGLV